MKALARTDLHRIRMAQASHAMGLLHCHPTDSNLNRKSVHR